MNSIKKYFSSKNRNHGFAICIFLLIIHFVFEIGNSYIAKTFFFLILIYSLFFPKKLSTLIFYWIVITRYIGNYLSLIVISFIYLIIFFSKIFFSFSKNKDLKLKYKNYKSAFFPNEYDLIDVNFDSES